MFLALALLLPHSAWCSTDTDTDSLFSHPGLFVPAEVVHHEDGSTTHRQDFSFTDEEGHWVSLFYDVQSSKHTIHLDEYSNENFTLQCGENEVHVRLIAAEAKTLFLNGSFIVSNEHSCSSSRTRSHKRADQILTCSKRKRDGAEREMLGTRQIVAVQHDEQTGNVRLDTRIAHATEVFRDARLVLRTSRLPRRGRQWVVPQHDLVQEHHEKRVSAGPISAALSFFSDFFGNVGSVLRNLDNIFTVAKAVIRLAATGSVSCKGLFPLVSLNESLAFNGKGAMSKAGAVCRGCNVALDVGLTFVLDIKKYAVQEFELSLGGSGSFNSSMTLNTMGKVDIKGDSVAWAMNPIALKAFSVFELDLTFTRTLGVRGRKNSPSSVEVRGGAEMCFNIGVQWDNARDALVPVESFFVSADSGSALVGDTAQIALQVYTTLQVRLTLSYAGVSFGGPTASIEPYVELLSDDGARGQRCESGRVQASVSAGMAAYLGAEVDISLGEVEVFKKKLFSTRLADIKLPLLSDCVVLNTMASSLSSQTSVVPSKPLVGNMWQATSPLGSTYLLELIDVFVPASNNTPPFIFEDYQLFYLEISGPFTLSAAGCANFSPQCQFHCSRIAFYRTGELDSGEFFKRMPRIELVSSVINMTCVPTSPNYDTSKGWPGQYGASVVDRFMPASFVPPNTSVPFPERGKVWTAVPARTMDSLTFMPITNRVAFSRAWNSTTVSLKEGSLTEASCSQMWPKAKSRAGGSSALEISRPVLFLLVLIGAGVA